MSPLAGLSAFSVTPADADGRVETDHLGRLVDRLRIDGVSSIGVLGSTGGYVYLTPDERGRALRAALEAAGDVPVLAGIGAFTKREVLAHARAAQEAGAAGLLLAPVSYLPLSDEEVAHLFADVADASGLPLCFYNNPTTTGFDASRQLVSDLARAGTIAAVKNPPAPRGDFAGHIAGLREATPHGFVVGYSGDSAICGALQAGADAWYSVLAGTLPDMALTLWSARADACALQTADARLTPLWTLFDRHGGIRIVHEIVSMLGPSAVRLPAPLRPLDATARGAIERCLAELDATW